MEIERTADGSYTVYLPEMDEHYHSIKGALTESEYIFIEQAFNKCDKKNVTILEIGFGTGLNAVLTYMEANKNMRRTVYDSIEKYPLSIEFVEKLNYISVIGKENENIFNDIHKCQWDIDIKLSEYFTLHKIKGDFTNNIFNRKYDIVYFDAFAPEKQPEMWTQQLFDEMFNILNPGGILTTYCAKGIVRRMLQASGFKVERLPGPPNGKREILRATKTNG